jgi:hypothetical protein
VGKVYQEADALNELNTLERQYISATERHLEQGNALQIAYLLHALDREIENLVREGRNLKLQGKLDLKVYQILVTGYCQLGRKVLEISERNGFGEQVKSYYEALRFMRLRGSQ